MSDIAPNTTGIADVDHDRSMYLVELSLDFAKQTLQPGGDFLVKVFQGRGFQDFVQHAQTSFQHGEIPQAASVACTQRGTLCVGARL